MVLGFFSPCAHLTWFASVPSFIDACAGTKEGKVNVSKHGKDGFLLLAPVMAYAIFKVFVKVQLLICRNVLWRR